MTRFKDRVLTQEISPEFIRHQIGGDEERAYKRCEEAVKRLERSYAVVAEVERKTDFYASDTGYTIRAIAKQDANRDEIQHGMQSVLYWIGGGDD